MPRKEKRTKAVEITGRWVEKGDKIVRWKKIPADTKCTKCNGTDRFCSLCHGESCEPELKWYQYIKKLEKWLG